MCLFVHLVYSYVFYKMRDSSVLAPFCIYKLDTFISQSNMLLY